MFRVAECQKDQVVQSGRSVEEEIHQDSDRWRLIRSANVILPFGKPASCLRIGCEDYYEMNLCLCIHQTLNLIDSFANLKMHEDSPALWNLLFFLKKNLYKPTILSLLLFWKVFLFFWVSLDEVMNDFWDPKEETCFLEIWYTIIIIKYSKKAMTPNKNKQPEDQNVAQF